MPPTQSQIPRVPRWKGVQEARRMIANPIEVLAKHSSDLGPNYVYSFGGVRKAMITTDPAVTKHILKTNQDNYHKSDIQTKIMVEFLGTGLLTDTWDVWRPKRQSLAKAFAPKKLDDLASAVEAAMDDALAELERRAEYGPVGLKDEVTRITFAMAARSFLGMSFPLEDAAVLSKLIKSVQMFMTKLVVMPFLRPWWHLSGEMSRQQTDRLRGDALLEEQIANHSAGNADLLDVLLDMAAPSEGGEASLSPKQVLAEAMQILVAGHETSSNAFTWLLLLMNANPSARQIVEEEFAEVLGDRAPKFSDIAKLPRTNAIIEEALRLFPPFWMIDRCALSDDEVNGLHIAKGTRIVVFLWGMHRDTRHWQDPEAFQTDRFDKTMWQSREYFHIPFGAGPRRCIGVNYAKLQIVALLYRFLRDYDVTLLDGAQLAIDPKFILSPMGSIPAEISRKQTTS